MNDPYATLGVPRDASQEEINAAYRRAHANEIGVEEPPSRRHERLEQIEIAYDVLSDPERRAEYDAESPRWPVGVARPDLFREAPGYELRGPEPSPRHSRNPVDRLTRGLPHGVRVAIDWIVTIAGAILIVLAIKAWVVNPYRIPSSSMEPTLHCGGGVDRGCLARFSDRVLANRFIYHLRKPRFGEIVVFDTPPEVENICGSGGVFVKRLIGLPGDSVTYTQQGAEWALFINGKRVNENYVSSPGGEPGSWRVPEGQYFMMGDNRGASCDSRRWGSVPRDHLIGPVFATYWPPDRISIR